MSDRPPGDLVLDPCLAWGEEHPYRRLNARLETLGKTRVTPSSTMAEIHDCYYDLMAPGSRQDGDRQAWDELRKVGSRLLADFFLYEVSKIDPEEALGQSGRVEMPVELPDFRRMAEIPVDVAAALEPPERFELGERPGPVDLTAHEPPPLDLGSMPPPLAAYLDDREIDD
ncbi:MAG: hypothetical protein GY719_24985 [bacterium]|nr:hypothetical protein [bacterium]